jgi:hypothetical protein
MDKYIPGQCNIGKFESQRRLNVGIFGLIVAFSFSFVFFVFAFDKFIVFIILFLSTFIGILGVLQYYNHFCVYYGLLQVFNFENLVKLVSVRNLTDAEKDKQKALMLIIIATASSLAYAFLYIVLI